MGSAGRRAVWFHRNFGSWGAVGSLESRRLAAVAALSIFGSIQVPILVTRCAHPVQCILHCTQHPVGHPGPVESWPEDASVQRECRKKQPMKLARTSNHDFLKATRLSVRCLGLPTKWPPPNPWVLPESRLTTSWPLPMQSSLSLWSRASDAVERKGPNWASRVGKFCQATRETGLSRG